MKNILMVLLLILPSLGFAKPVVDCTDVGFWAAEITLFKNRGGTLDDAKGLFDLRQNMDPVEKYLLGVMADDIYNSGQNLGKDEANDYYKEQCEIGLQSAN